MTHSSQESSAYAALGASSAKAGVLKAVGESGTARYFASPIADIAGDPNAACFVHADGAGTKSIVAYLAYREFGKSDVFRSLAYDSMAMNLDDVACAGGTDNFILSNSIARNRSIIPDEAIAEIITGYREYADILSHEGVRIQLAGGETADMGDVVRTLVVDSTLCARVARSQLVDTWRVADGDLIVGFSSTGQARYERKVNSGIGSNGLTLARHALLSRDLSSRYPEIVDPNTPTAITHRGTLGLADQVPGLSLTVSEALLSPTRSYSPLIRTLLTTLGPRIHSFIHCTGGGQSKIMRFGRGVRYEKDNLFETPPLFSLIQQQGEVPWSEMYAVFNMGHRLEACVEPGVEEEVIGLSRQFGIAAQVIGRVTSTGGENEVVLSTKHGTFHYKPS